MTTRIKHCIINISTAPISTLLAVLFIGYLIPIQILLWSLLLQEKVRGFKCYLVTWLFKCLQTINISLHMAWQYNFYIIVCFIWYISLHGAVWCLSVYRVLLTMVSQAIQMTNNGNNFSLCFDSFPACRKNSLISLYLWCMYCVSVSKNLMRESKTKRWFCIQSQMGWG